MPQYVIFLIIAALSIIVVYVIVIPSALKLRWKLMIFLLSFSGAALTYFAARDIFGRADPFPLPGKYVIRFVEKNKKDGKIYVYVTGKRNDPAFEPRLLLLDPEKMGRNKKGTPITSQMLEIGQEGQGQLQLELKKKNSWYGPSESSISIEDPLTDILEPKEK